MKYEFDYDSSGDSLFIHRKNANVRYSIEIGDNYVIDIDFDGKVSGIEIFHVSKLFGIPKYMLKKIKRTSLVTRMGNPLVIFVHLSLAEPNIKVPAHTITIPQTVAVSARKK